MKNIRMPTVVGLIKAENTLPAISSADAGKLATVDSNGKWAAANLTVGQGQVAVDTTLAVTGAAADAKVTGDKVAELKSAIANLDSVVGAGYANMPPAYNGSFTANGAGTLTESSNRIRTGFIQLHDGDKIDIDCGSLKHAVGGWSGVIGSGTNTRNDSTFSSASETIIATADCYYVIVFAKQDAAQNITPSDFDGYIHLYSNLVNKNAENISALQTDFDNLETGAVVVNAPVRETIETALTNTAGYVVANGTVNPGGTSYYYSQKIAVVPGDLITPLGDGNAPYFRFVCAYNGNTAVTAAGSNDARLFYEVPAGINGIIVSTSQSQNTTSISINHQTGTEKRVYPISQKLGRFTWSGDLGDGDTVDLVHSNVRFNTTWVFTGHVTTMGKISIGVKPDGGDLKVLCAVDTTNVYYRTNSGSLAYEAHGLTIDEDLQIIIESPFKVNELGGITICSDGTEYAVSASTFGTDMTGAPHLVSDGATMTGCVFSWIPKDIDKPIWVFGDSWVSMYENRWPYYMVRDGFTNTWMLNGFAGEDSMTAYESLNNLLAIRKPEYLVWLLGMNDKDNNTAVNEKWKFVYDKLTALCESYAINLILYTVPNTPTINNNFKNAIVKASGYRYIDGVAAVGDDGVGNWFTGFEQSASDHNHTSTKGAKALYYRILADFPEIAGNSL